MAALKDEKSNELNVREIPLMWNGYCPESWLLGKTVKMKLNRNDLYESEATGLQLALIPNVQVVILMKRGIGEFRSTPVYGDEVESGEILSPQNSDRPPFNDPPVIFKDSNEIEAYIRAIR